MFGKILFVAFVIGIVNGLEFQYNGSCKKLIQRDFLLSTNWICCEERLPFMFYYKIGKDNGSYGRVSSFYKDPLISDECQQISTSAYSNLHDRGHMVPANHVDSSKEAIKESNFMTNIAPQTSVLNQNAWLSAEEIVECWRDIVDLEVLGGPIMGTNTSNDIFIKSHGVRTPDYYWKIVTKVSDGDVIAWIMPNDQTAVKSKLDSYLVTIGEIEKRTGFTFTQFNDCQRTKVVQKSWGTTTNCDYS